jgi:sugar phosphate isomerase/epimerase
VLVETHDAWSLGSDVADLVRGIEGAGVVWDIAHTLRATETCADTLGHIGSPALVHVKDATGATLTHLGEGDLDLRGAIDALQAIGYERWVSVEWEKLWHPYLDDAETALPRGIAFLRA